MILPTALPALSAVAADYDILLCDVWGVIHNGRESWPEACEALTKFNQQGGHVVLISNSPRPSHDVVAQLDHLKLLGCEFAQGFHISAPLRPEDATALLRDLTLSR